jgi:hypothetical protein
LIGDFPKLVELTPCRHRSEKNSISTAFGILAGTSAKTDKKIGKIFEEILSR